MPVKIKTIITSLCTNLYCFLSPENFLQQEISGLHTASLRWKSQVKRGSCMFVGKAMAQPNHVHNRVSLYTISIYNLCYKLQHAAIALDLHSSLTFCAYDHTCTMYLILSYHLPAVTVPNLLHFISARKTLISMQH